MQKYGDGYTVYHDRILSRRLDLMGVDFDRDIRIFGMDVRVDIGIDVLSRCDGCIITSL